MSDGDHDDFSRDKKKKKTKNCRCHLVNAVATFRSAVRDHFTLFCVVRATAIRCTAIPQAPNLF